MKYISLVFLLCIASLSAMEMNNYLHHHDQILEIKLILQDVKNIADKACKDALETNDLKKKQYHIQTIRDLWKDLTHTFKYLSNEKHYKGVCADFEKYAEKLSIKLTEKTD